MNEPTANELAALARRIQERNPTRTIGVSRSLIAVHQNGEWVPIISGLAIGGFVDLGGQGLGLINGKRPYEQSDFVPLDNS